jgi:hypothetical protein
LAGKTKITAAAAMANPKLRILGSLSALFWLQRRSSRIVPVRLGSRYLISRTRAWLKMKPDVPALN